VSQFEIKRTMPCNVALAPVRAAAMALSQACRFIRSTTSRGGPLKYAIGYDDLINADQNQKPEDANAGL
jgi:hypothetical protein